MPSTRFNCCSGSNAWYFCSKTEVKELLRWVDPWSRAEETEWDERKQKHRAVTWSLDVSVAVIMRSGTIKKYFPDKVLGGTWMANVGNMHGTCVGSLDHQGFGFICPDGGGDDIFAHSRQYTGQGEADNVKAFLEALR